MITHFIPMTLEDTWIHNMKDLFIPHYLTKFWSIFYCPCIIHLNKVTSYLCHLRWFDLLDLKKVSNGEESDGQGTDADHKNDQWRTAGYVGLQILQRIQQQHLQQEENITSPLHQPLHRMHQIHTPLNVADIRLWISLHWVSSLLAVVCNQRGHQNGFLNTSLCYLSVNYLVTDYCEI